MNFPKVEGIFATSVMLKYNLRTLIDTFVPIFDGKAFWKEDRKVLETLGELQGMPSQCCDMGSNGNKKELKETQIVTYHLRVGDYWLSYQIDEAENEVKVKIEKLKYVTPKNLKDALSKVGASKNK